MIIGLDASSIPYSTGVSVYTLNLIRHLVRNYPNHQFKIFFSSLRQPLPSSLTQLSFKPNVKIYRFFLPPTILAFLWNRLHLVPLEFFIGKCHIFHTWDWYQPPSWQAKIVNTVHDLVPFLYPQWQHPKIITTFNQKYQRISSSSGIICVSATTQKDLHRLFPQTKSVPTQVIYEAAETKYFQFSRLSPEIQQQKIDQIKRLYDLSSYVLAQGTREPRKNLDRLIRAFIKFKQLHPHSRLELAIAGKYGWGQDVNHLSHPYIKILGFIPEKDMVPLHAGATILAYTSLYEGFGLPVAKALALGVPVLTSLNTPMAEFTPDCALHVNPKSTRSIYLGLKQLIQNPSLRHQLASKGLIQAQKLTWSQVASKTLKFYQSLFSPSLLA
jgi:glycosyltransferase involved in cell wall biosynthesis